MAEEQQKSTGGPVGPPRLDLTIDNITPNPIRINRQSPDAPLTYLLARLVTHLHDFAREPRLSTAECMPAIEFLIGYGKICGDVRKVCWVLFPSLFAPPPPPPFFLGYLFMSFS